MHFSVYNIIFSVKFLKQCNEQTNGNVPSQHAPITLGLKFKMRFLNLYDNLQVYVCFIRLEKLVCQNKRFIIIYSNNIGQSSIQRSIN